MTTVRTLHSARSGAATPTQTLDAIQLHAQAENALSMALHYMRQTASNVPGAARKTVQALDAMNRIKLAGYGQAANDSGRA